MIRNRLISFLFFPLSLVGQALSRTNCSRVIYLWRVYDGHMQRFVHSEEIFFNERNISFPFPFYYFANDTTVTARALQEDEIKNDFFLSFFFFCPRNVSSPSSPSSRLVQDTERNNCAEGRQGIIHFFEHHYPLIFIQQRETGPFS